MDQAFPFFGTKPDGDILNRPAKTRHRVPLEVRQDNIRIIIREMRTHPIAFKARSTLHGQFHGTLRIQNVHIRNRRKSMILRYLHVHGRFRPGAAICRIALHNRTVHGLYQVLNQFRIEIITCRRLSC